MLTDVDPHQFCDKVKLNVISESEGTGTSADIRGSASILRQSESEIVCDQEKH